MTEPLTIVLFTYAPSLASPRHEYAVRTLESTLSQIEHAGPLYLHIAHDGSAKESVDYLKNIAGGLGLSGEITVSDAERGGYGHSYNLASQVTGSRGGMVLCLEDDWIAVRNINVDRLRYAFNHEPDVVGCVRLGYIGFTKVLRGKIIHTSNENYLYFDPDCEETHVFTGHPRLETVDWQRWLGEWPTGLNPGETELVVASNRRSRVGVVWPLEGAPYYAHIGTKSFRDD